MSHKAFNPSCLPASSNNTLNASALTTTRAFLYGQNGDDTISGGKANDILSGGAGNDTLNGSDGTDYLRETADVNFTVAEGTLTGLGTDTFSNIEIVQLFGGNSNNTLDASALTTTRAFLYGQNGDDLLKGGATNDTLFGGIGDDTLIGGTGIDTASYYTTIGSVSVNLETGNANDGEGGTDTFPKLKIFKAQIPQAIISRVMPIIIRSMDMAVMTPSRVGMVTIP